MTIVTAEKTWTWSPEVLALAKKLGVEAYLDPLLEATQDLFPEAREIRVYPWRDPEIDSVEAVSFEVDLPMADLGNYTNLTGQWIRVLYRVCPKPLVCSFTQILIPVSP